MTRLTTLAIALLAGIASAHSGENGKGDATPQRMLIDTQPTVVKTALEKLTGSPISIVTPSVKPIDPNEIPPGWSMLPIAPPPERSPASKIVLRDEYGGRLDQHRRRFAAYLASGDDVEIRGVCFSACTLVMSFVPRNRICFSSLGFLSFHKASHGDGTMSWDDTLAVVSSYPADIQKWLEAKGGAANMPHKVRSPWDAWMLTAKDLWAMGYRKCD